MSSDTLQAKTALPEGFQRWAKKYFSKSADVEVTLDLDLLFNNEYMRIRESLRKQLENAEKLSDFDSQYADELKKIDDLQDVTALQKFVARIREATNERRQEIRKRMEKLHADVLFEQLDLKHDPNVVRDNVFGLLKAWDLAAAEKAVNLFDAQVERAKSTNLGEGHTVEKLHEKNKLQNAQYARNTHQAKVIATRLIGPDGKLILEADKDIVLKDLPLYTSDDLLFLMDEIRSGKHPDLPQNEHALVMLQKIKNDKSLQQELERVAKPSQQDSVAAQLIRDVLGLAPGTEVTDVHARQAALSGLLTQTRQGAVGSCFATALACKTQREQPQLFVKQIGELFANGKHVHRTKDGSGNWVTIEIPLNKEVVQGELEKNTDVKRKDSTLHLAPDMVAAMDILGIPADEQKPALEAAARLSRAEQALDDALSETRFPDAMLQPPNTREAVRAAVLAALQSDSTLTIKKALQNEFASRNLSMATGTSAAEKKAGGLAKQAALARCSDFDDENGTDAIKPQELIAWMCKAKLPPNKQAESLKAARDAYLGQQDNLMLRAYEYTIATATERVPGKFSNKAYLNDGASKTSKKFMDDFIDAQSIDVPSKDELKDYNLTLQAELDRLMDEKLESRYNPSVKKRTDVVASDGHSSSGGFSLYYKDKQITSAAEYKSALSEMISEATNNIWSGLTPYQQQCSPIINQNLIDELDNDSFHEDVVDRMVADLGGEKNDVVKPWARADGGYNDNISRIYGDIEGDVQRLESPSTVVNGESLADFLLDTFKSMKVDKILGVNAKQEESSITVATKGVHAFNLLPGSPGVLALLNGKDDPKEALQEFLTDERAKAVKRNSAELPFTNPPQGTIHKMIEAAVTIFPEANRGAVSAGIVSALASAGKDKLTLPEIRTAILDRTSHYLAVLFPNLSNDEVADYADRCMNSASGVAMQAVVPKEEFDRLTELCLDRLKVPEEIRKKVVDGVREALKDANSTGRDQLAKLIEQELRKEKAMERPDRIETAMKEPPGMVFCDLNWGNGDHRVLGTMVVNPETGELEFWQVNEDGSEATKMNQKEWITDTDWQVYQDPNEWGGIIGDPAWEKKRAELQGAMEKCVGHAIGDIKANIGDIGTMKNLLDLADQRFADRQFEQATKTLESLEKLTKSALALAANLNQAVNELKGFEQEVVKANVKSSKAASQQIKALIAGVKFVRRTEDVDPFLSRHSKLCDLLKQGKDSLGVAVDLPAILKKPA